MTVGETDDRLNINLRVFDDEPYTTTEKKQYANLLAEKLDRPKDSVNVKLTEIPTVSVLNSFERAKTEKNAPVIPTVAELKETLLERIETALSDFRLPPPAQIVRKQIVTGENTPLEVKIIYLNDEQIAPETEKALLEKARQSLNYDQASISLERIPINVGEIIFSRNQSALTLLGMLQLDFAGRTMRENPKLQIVVAIRSAKVERPEIAAERQRTIAEYLETRWQIAPGKIIFSAIPTATTQIFFQIKGEPTMPDAAPPS